MFFALALCAGHDVQITGKAFLGRKWQYKTELTAAGFELRVPRRGTAMLGLRDDPPSPKVLYSTRPTVCRNKLYLAATRASQREIFYNLFMSLL